MRHISKQPALRVILVLMLGTLTQGCSGDEDPEVVSSLSLAIPCTDSVSSVFGDPGTLPSDKGEIIRCARDRAIPLAELQSRAETNGYDGRSFVSGAQVYRVLYRTERANDAEGYSSATLLVPETPKAQVLPVVIASHGARGQASVCAPSLEDQAGAYVQGDFERLVFPLVGDGYAVFAPDLAGYANLGAQNNPPSALFSAADTSKSTLDGIIAMRKLLYNHLSDKIVLVGHSMGGHTTLSTLALADQYGVDGTISAVATYAPLWINQASWPAILPVYGDYSISLVSMPTAISVWYHYTQAELLDGPGQGYGVFAEDIRNQIKTFVENVCWSPSYPSLEVLGPKVADLFSPQFINSISYASLGMANCPDNTCETWMARYAADRPHLTGAAANVPILASVRIAGYHHRSRSSLVCIGALETRRGQL